MSYIRFGERDSDVYVYLAISGGIECCFCNLSDDESEECFTTMDATAMAQHLHDHRKFGDVVPDGVIEAVLANPELDPSKDRL